MISGRSYSRRASLTVWSESRFKLPQRLTQSESSWHRLMLERRRPSENWMSVIRITPCFTTNSIPRRWTTMIFWLSINLCRLQRLQIKVIPIKCSNRIQRRTFNWLSCNKNTILWNTSAESWMNTKPKLKKNWPSSEKNSTIRNKSWTRSMRTWTASIAPMISASQPRNNFKSSWSSSSRQTFLKAPQFCSFN